MTATATVALHAGCAAVCLAWAALVLVAGRGRLALLHAAACGAAALWAGSVALFAGTALADLATAAEILRNLVWCGLLLVLAQRIGGARARPLVQRFALAGLATGLLAAATLWPSGAAALTLPGLGAPLLLARLPLALLIVLLAENLYRNALETARWYVNLPCIALGGLGILDILVQAEAVLAPAASPVLVDARAALTALAMPLLAIAAVRDRRWGGDPPVSREVVFHGATLVIAGAVLLGIGALGEVLRRLDAEWGRTAQVTLLGTALMALAVAVSSGSARSRLRRLVVDHFFRSRYDYRREWLRCVGTLSAPETEAEAAIRAIRAIADPVDSPAGVLLLRDTADGALRWGGSWNLPAGPAVPADGTALPGLLRDGGWIAEFAAHPGQARPLGPFLSHPLGRPPRAPAPVAPPAELVAAYGPLWLAVPLLHHREGLLGAVLLAPPRAPFGLDGEVFDLLRTLGREVALFLAERRAAARLVEQRQVQDYAKRFAFVAHDVKTVSSQLSLVLANAEHHLHDPEFQRDMLMTVGAAAGRINTLIARLGQPGDDPAPAAPAGPTTAPLPRLRAMAADRRGLVDLTVDGTVTGLVPMAADRFDAAVTHLLNNALEASRPGDPVRMRVRQDAGRMVVDITDQGEGMTPEFIRDELFRPLSTSKPDGSGIGAWQARDLLEAAGGTLAALSSPGAGTTMRLILPLQAAAAATDSSLP